MREAVQNGTTEMRRLDLEKLRHELSNGKALMTTAFNLATSDEPDFVEARALFRMGDEKATSTLGHLDEAIATKVEKQSHSAASTISAERLGYNGTEEAIYTAEHPDVLLWTKKFEARTRNAAIFQTMIQTHNTSSKERANVVGVLWHRFSEYMPQFLCQAAAQVSTNQIRHYVIQTAFEELGMRDSTEIHPDMFWQSALSAGVTAQDKDRLENDTRVNKTLNVLKEALSSSKTDSEILGMLLGLEIPAIENIEMIYQSLAHTEELRSTLAQSKFFALHRQIEIEHVRLTVANFIRFCTTSADKADFIKGFENGLEFWQTYWNAVSAAITAEKTRGVSHAS
jgi:hypothetical protein